MRALALVVLALFGQTARAETRTYVIAVGNNAAPLAEPDGVSTLQYADDDAAAFFTFTRELSQRSTLLAILDSDTQRRYPELVGVARPPTLAELRRVVAEYRDRLLADQREGHEAVLLFFYSGHGSRGQGRPPSLAMGDGALTQAVLYDEILAQAPARYVHLIVDACHAEAVVRPRDVEAQAVELGDQDVQSYAARATLDRFPQVGAVIATASGAQAHEWEQYQQGVFSHEVMSGLRGAADVNRDGRIEYSELYAFLAAANRQVADPRARLSVIARPPTVNPRAPLVDLAQLRRGTKLVGLASALGRVSVEDERGNRLVDARVEAGFQVAIALPSDETLYLHSDRGEAVLVPRDHVPIDLSRVRLRRAATAARGAIDVAMQRGLFVTPFGPIYYRGFVDRDNELSPVSLPADDGTAPFLDARPARPRSRRAAAFVFGGAGVLAGVAGVFAGLAGKARADYNGTQLERPATDARERFDAFGGMAIGSAVAAAIGGSVATWLWVRAK